MVKAICFTRPVFKIFVSMIIGLLFCNGYAGISVFAAQQTAIEVIVNGEKVDLPVKPIIVKGSIMLPMKSVFDVAHIDSSLVKQTITVENGSATFKAFVNQKQIYAGTHLIRLAQEPIIQNGRLFVPARFVALVLDRDVSYDPYKRQVVIGYTAESMLGFQKSLFEAAMHGDALTAEKMLKRGVYPDVKLLSIYLDNTPLDYAVIHNYTNVARVLLDNGATIEAAGQELGFQAILHQNAELLGLLLTAGLDPNHQDNTGTLLESASGLIGVGDGHGNETTLYPSYAVVKVLLDHGADPGIDDSLTQAINTRNADIIKALLAAGADPYKTNKNGSTPYALSQYYGVSQLLTSGSDRPNIPTLQFLNSDGSILADGGFTLLSADSLNDYRQFDWSNGIAYLGDTSGRYRLMNVSTYRFAWLQLKNDEIDVKGGIADPSAVRLPDLNVRGTITVDGSAADNEGMLEIADESGNGIGLVQVVNNRFDFYLPEGRYSILTYKESDRIYAVNRSISVGEDEESQQIAVSASSE